MKYTFLFFLIFIFGSVVSAQQNDTLQIFAPDSLDIISPDTTLTDSAAFPDSTIALDSTETKSGDEIDAVVYASASDSLTFDILNKKMYVYDSGELKYKDTELTAAQIAVDFETNSLDAIGVADTSDTTGNTYLQTPVMSEAGEVFEGFSLEYNFKNKRGFISAAKNAEEDSRYEGKSVKKVSKDILFIDDGIYTTCSESPPHSHFSAAQMKVIHQDKIIAKWIFLHIGGVPLPLPLPFGVFPIEKGRRSGLIVPSYGEDASRGQYFRNFGYFWAISDYMDLALNGDYYSKGGFGSRGRFRYVQRYIYNGNINLGLSNVESGEQGDPGYSDRKDYNLEIYHNHKFNPTTNLNVNLRFLSSSYLSTNSTQYDDLLRKNITSNATFSKRWDESGNSISINYSRTQNLSSGDITEKLPDVTFNKTLSYPFKRKGVSKKDQAWYEYIGYNYSGRFRNDRNKREGDLKIRGGFQHTVGMSASPKLGYFNVSPRIGYSEKWYNKRIIKDVYYVEHINSDGESVTADSVVDRDMYEINMVRSFDFSLSASTKIYGMAQLNNFGIEAFRHTLQPSVSYNYSPDFSEDKWGYYDSYISHDGSVKRYDKFSREIYGGAGRGERQSLNFSLGNIFEMKTLKDQTDTTSEAKKYQLLNLNGSVGYNFAADSLKLSDLRVSYRTQIGELLNFSGSSSYTFYDYDENKKINKFLSSVGKGLLRLTNFSFSLSTNISGDKLAGEKRKGTEDEIDPEYDAFRGEDYIALYGEEEPDFSIPWNLSLNYNYSLSKRNASDVTRTSNIGLNLGFNLTKNWKITMRGNYDLERKQIAAPQVTVYRDLHCWEMNFTWNPIGTYRGFRFEIKIKAPELQDIKVTKTKDIFSGF
ncbi:MAG: LPS-assembly protein LptD [Melioribacteraceae bacterium]|nr:LPS-assembly protein LptD [Melioribacteraceae bacterium]MCF8394663.1 LPS-assembly protein LptD [Melioribacteraceae bacterium]MCF8418003.1 LPS-assembly protein LptD [Melioribacteraceae bacterium]